MTLQLREPTGRPAWPLILLAGIEKSGKSWAAAEASNSPLLGATYWISCGEDDPDELGRIGHFAIVEHDGSYNAIRQAILDVNNIPDAAGKPSLIVLDSISMVWSMLTDEAQALANARAAAKAEKYKKPAPTDDVTIGMDLWNRAAGRWRKLMDAFRAHKGPVLLTARLSQVSILNAKGDPTGEKDWKVEGHKTLPFDATVIVQLRSRSERYLTGVRSVVWQTEPEAMLPFPDGKTIPDLWQLLGLADATDRVHRAPDGAASLHVEDQVRQALLGRLAAVSSDMARVEAHWQSKHGEPLAEASDLRALLELTEWGERIHADGQATQTAAAAPAARTRPATSRADTLPDEPPAGPQTTPQPGHVAEPVDDARRHALLSRIAQQFARLDITDRTERLYYTAQLTNHPGLATSADLTDQQMRQLLLALDRCRDRDALETILTTTEGTPAHV